MLAFPVYLAYLFNYFQQTVLITSFVSETPRHIAFHIIVFSTHLPYQRLFACCSVKNKHCQGFAVQHPLILGTFTFSTKGITDRPVFNMHASGGVNTTSGTRGEDLTLAQPIRLSHFTAVDWFMNRHMAQPEPEEWNRTFVSTMGRGMLTFLLNLNLGGCKCGNAKSHFYHSRRVTPASEFPWGWLSSALSLYHNPSFSAQFCFLPFSSSPRADPGSSFS